MVTYSSTLANPRGFYLPMGNITGQLSLDNIGFLMMAKTASELNKWDQGKLE